MKRIGLVFPHQLFRRHPMLEAVDEVCLIEETLFFNQYRFHQQKIAFHRSSMKAMEADMKNRGIPCAYVEAHQPESDARVWIASVSREKDVELNYIDPTDDWLSRRLERSVRHHGIPMRVHESALFLNRREELKTFFRGDKKSFFQTTFYKQQRKKHGWLMDESGAPVGGKWSYDAENRRKYPRNKTAPPVDFPAPNSFWDEAVVYTRQHFGSNPGHLSTHPLYPSTPSEARAWFRDFSRTRFAEFGAYEDAIVRDEWLLHHSLFSPLLNTGLLTPKEVLNEAIAFAEENNVPLNSVEGFARQIMGWREFVRGMYECKGVESRTRNFWGFDREIPAAFYDATTGIDPVDAAIRKTLETGYCHHIERLMVLGGFMLLCEFDPDAVYRWFMELFIDAYDWVMVPNVYGMSQFADGGLFATKPYICGSNYIRKMSDHPAGPWQETWDALFWRFVFVHRSFFEANPRLSMMLRSWDRFSEEKKGAHVSTANAFLESLRA